MKKKILGGIVAVAIAAVAAVNVNFNNEGENGLSALSVANIEALADGEGSTPCPKGCKVVGWGVFEILRCDCSYTGYFSSCNTWGC